MGPRGIWREFWVACSGEPLEDVAKNLIAGLIIGLVQKYTLQTSNQQRNTFV